MQIVLLFGILAYYIALAVVHPTTGVVKRFLQTFHDRNETGRNARKLTLSNSFTIRVLDLMETRNSTHRGERGARFLILHSVGCGAVFRVEPGLWS
ncbi:hypothetical protein EV702DRAFT_713848 [Suillus placidus]|uniref:Uncharacterized protein n=1 Tax=Suillus placidus TaxID=48579 RepID=A0A9P7CYD2_9AGAM|nr:hypothetical protein EV702DRAFT_713848 [Suillus placidus]